MSKKHLLEIVEQLFWTILAILMMISAIVSFVADNMIYLSVGLIVIAAAICIGMIIFVIVSDRLMKKDSEEED